MLQISSGKFYENNEIDQLYITTHRGVLFTNHGFLLDRIATPVGDLLPAARWGDLQTIVCEVTERLPKFGGQMRAGDIVSVGPDTLIQDFSALVSFRLNVTCTPDRDLAQRLIVAQRPPLGISALPREYVSRMFDASIPYRGEDIDDLRSFITDLMGLSRKSYSGVMRAIRRYVTSMHRLADDLDLSYALLVASIESLAQEFDEFAPAWGDYPQQKRKPVDDALVGVTEDVCARVRQAILKSEHVASKRRFYEFSDHYLQPKFFREEAKDQLYPVGRTELGIALKNAYDLRSKYIHALKPLPKNLVLRPSHNDTQIVESRYLLTFHGLARVARHIILEFVKQSPKVAQERFDYTSDYPNMLRMQWAPQYWIGNPDAYTLDTSRMVLNGFLSQVASQIFDPTQKVTDLRLVVKKIETIVPSLAKLEQKMPMLALHFLFNAYLPSDEQVPGQTFLQPYLEHFDNPSIDSLLAHFLGGAQKPVWSLENSDLLLAEYNKQRFHKNGLNAGPLIGAALILWVAEMHRASGNHERAHELIAHAAEEYPQQKGIYEFEKRHPAGEYRIRMARLRSRRIDWHRPS